MTKKQWICENCEYELPLGSDLLKLCPNCHKIGTFVEFKVLLNTKYRKIGGKNNEWNINENTLRNNGRKFKEK